MMKNVPLSVKIAAVYLLVFSVEFLIGYLIGGDVSDGFLLGAGGVVMMSMMHVMVVIMSKD